MSNEELERHSAIFAINPLVAAAFCDTLARTLGDEWPIEIVRGGGDALRRIERFSHRQILVCVDRPHLDVTARLIDVIRQRRPQLLRLAIALAHDDAIERATRSAGATHYFTLHHSTDVQAIRQTLALTEASMLVSTRCDLPPPPSRPRAARSALSGLGRRNHFNHHDIPEGERR